MTNHRSNIPTFRYDNKQFDYSRGEADHNHTTLLRSIEVSDQSVLRILILNNRIEQTILVPTTDEGNELTKTSYPRNCNGVYSADCFQMGHKLGGMSTQTLNVYKGKFRTDVDKTKLVA